MPIIVDPPTSQRASAGSRLRAAGSRARQALAVNGLDLAAMARAGRGIAPYLADRRAYRRGLSGSDPASSMPFRALPVLGDRYADAGVMDGQYFRQDLFVAGLVHKTAPVRHVDVGSRIDGFVAHLLVFRDVEVIDVRPLRTDVPGLRFVQADATTLHELADASIPSLSSLHAVEHFGLGRYGDPVDPAGPTKVLASFARVLAPGGRLYLSVPVGVRRVDFNAHRVFDPSEVPDLLPGLRMVRFAGIDDDGHFADDARPADFASNSYGLGIYVFERPVDTAR